MTQECIIDSYEQRVVVFLDILGFKDLLNTVSMDRIRTTLGLLQSITEQKNASNIKGREITVFSDSIVMSYPKQQSGAFRQLILDILRYQKTLIKLGYPLRGAVEIGALYHRNINTARPMIFGEGFVKAYELEEKGAIYPRVILSDSVWAWGLENPSIDPNDDINLDGNEPFSQYVKNISISRDFDGYRFIDPLKVALDDFLDTQKDHGFIHTCRSLIIEKLHIETELKILNKWRWFANYFNKATEEYTEIFIPIEI